MLFHFLYYTARNLLNIDMKHFQTVRVLECTYYCKFRRVSVPVRIVSEMDFQKAVLTFSINNLCAFLIDAVLIPWQQHSK